MDGVTDYENRPGPGAFSCWSPLHYPFPEPIETVAGQEMRIHGAHDRTNLTIRLD